VPVVREHEAVRSESESFQSVGVQALLLQSKQSHAPILLSVQQSYARVTAEIFEAPCNCEQTNMSASDLLN